MTTILAALELVFLGIVALLLFMAAVFVLHGVFKFTSPAAKRRRAARRARRRV